MYKVEPRLCVLACNLLTNDDCRATLLDEPIPALGNKSPRAAVRTAKGRARVVDWLKTIENHTAESASHNDEMAIYDFSWLWAELGVNELRR